MNFLNDVSIEHFSVIGVEPLKAPVDAVNLVYAIVELEAEQDLSDYDVEAWAQPPASHDRRLYLFRTEEVVLPRASSDELRRDFPLRMLFVNDDVL